MRLLAEILLAAFFISYFIDKRTVLNGKLLCGSMLCFMIYLLQSMQNSPHLLVSAMGFFSVMGNHDGTAAAVFFSGCGDDF